jgi:hypothetical protein
MNKAILKIDGRTVASVPVSFPFPYELEALVDGVSTKFWWTGDTNEQADPVYSNVEEKVKW